MAVVGDIFERYVHQKYGIKNLLNKKEIKIKIKMELNKNLARSR